jgi:3-(3-hydroxy-phenyl)propionate hydroxylase
MEKFRHGRVLFAGDSAHGVSPFGARGANSGVQDADNLAWKLKLVLAGKAPDTLLDTYGYEREQAADENILNSTRATDFITPKSAISRNFRDAVLLLSKECPFARTIVNSGRLSVPATYRASALSTSDIDEFKGGVIPGAPAMDSPVEIEGEQQGWILPLLGNDFNGVYFAGEEEIPPKTLDALHSLSHMEIPVKSIIVTAPARMPSAAMDGVTVVADVQGLMTERFEARPGTFYLLRPDQHVCARWRVLDTEQVRTAVLTATCNV